MGQYMSHPEPHINYLGRRKETQPQSGRTGSLGAGCEGHTCHSKQCHSVLGYVHNHVHNHIHSHHGNHTKNVEVDSLKNYYNVSSFI